MCCSRSGAGPIAAVVRAMAGSVVKWKAVAFFCEDVMSQKEAAELERRADRRPSAATRRRRERNGVPGGVRGSPVPNSIKRMMVAPWPGREGNSLLSYGLELGNPVKSQDMREGHTKALNGDARGSYSPPAPRQKFAEGW